MFLYRWVLRHSPLILTTLIALGFHLWAYAQDSDTLIAISANIWGIVVLLIVFDVTPRDTEEKKEQR